jgi:hypothetical protein
METDELKNIWQALAKEKLIGNELAKENIERIINKKNSSLINNLSKKARTDLIMNISSSVFVFGAMILATVVNSQHAVKMPLTAYLFLSLTIFFFAFKAIKTSSRIKLLRLSFTTVSMKDSFEKLRQAFLKIYKEESIFSLVTFLIITLLANIVINEKTDFSNFNILSLQGFTLIVSIISIIAGPFVEKYLFKKRFSVIFNDIEKNINDLNSEK